MQCVILFNEHTKTAEYAPIFNLNKNPENDVKYTINPSLKQSHNLQNDLQGRFANSGCTNTLYLVYEHSTDINVGAIKICSCRRFLDSAICQKYFDILSEQTRIV
ncbi:Hypothetical_protein [Hexamita inflata]|uniref:Hypothetical_protein n=1 Tax=Hexamita inflata TaxID=28002 RepID=A0AA86UT12_9EUKA|nr:Hypothetical protein HINF_LOCUS51224 [Hexamita inflata]CAI9963581.1 Hypothetical protein HINF_LOCUS51226 [Hexamita inflata]